jgi:PEP-CTERM motif
MFAGTGNSTGGGRAVTCGSLATGALGLALTVMFSGGVLHASPITNLDEWQPLNSKQAPSHPVPAGVAKAKSGSPERQPALVLSGAVGSAGACSFSDDCYRSIQVPEPQSLLMVGTGLLSMAGLIRRRWVR